MRAPSTSTDVDANEGLPTREPARSTLIPSSLDDGTARSTTPATLTRLGPPSADPLSVTGEFTISPATTLIFISLGYFLISKIFGPLLVRKTLPDEADPGAAKSSAEVLATASTSRGSRHSRNSFLLSCSGDGATTPGSPCSFVPGARSAPGASSAATVRTVANSTTGPVGNPAVSPSHDDDSPGAGTTPPVGRSLPKPRRLSSLSVSIS
ncbi:hypothetical protein ALC56_10295 [Trachymyrmex septentrionalis]|uniref:Uncharacterized protein n=1 Tax=Trachymyrmex septentrionalis TaxID=34720 RepID=A0A151JTT2_9HYME|nr:hypothetical protein ALC56_10295 [Trachymyrmex septentrionalis]